MVANTTVTSRSRIVSALRGALWLRSSERSSCLKLNSYTCITCGRKKSVAKGKEVRVDIHHKKEINWDKIVSVIRKELLCGPHMLTCLCRECHKEHHGRNA